MPWERLYQPNKKETHELEQELGGKAQFLIDENINEIVTEILRRKGWNAISVTEVNLAGHSDEDVLAYAWREDRILLTQDHNFLDDRRFPEHRNPGIIILPSEPVGSSKFAHSLLQALTIVGSFRKLYRGAKIVFTRDNELSITNRDRGTGAIRKERYRLGRGADVYIWVES
jgi:predicted nuclease of predicted toxin-antitoxin system